MKKFILFLILLLLPICLASIVLYHFYPSDCKILINMVKEKIVSIYPPLEMYIKLDRPPVIKPPLVENSPRRMTLPPVRYFMNSEIYESICGDVPKVNLGKIFTGCSFCPKYLAKETTEKSFNYRSEVRGTVLRKGEEEALIFMQGCSRKDENGTAIAIRKGYGGWRREALFPNILFDIPPLEFKDEEGFYIFVGKRTISNSNNMRSELIAVRLKNKSLSEKILFTSILDTGEHCNEILQVAFENPMKKDSKSFQTQLEILSCKKRFLSGSYILHFNLENGNFRPNSETSKLITKIEKYGELK